MTGFALPRLRGPASHLPPQSSRPEEPYRVLHQHHRVGPSVACGQHMFICTELKVRKVFQLSSVPRAKGRNPAKVGTKALPGDAVLKHVAFDGGCCARGRMSKDILAEGVCDTLHMDRPARHMSSRIACDQA